MTDFACSNVGTLIRLTEWFMHEIEKRSGAT
jgi:hypothetical protein